MNTDQAFGPLPAESAPPAWMSAAPATDSERLDRIESRLADLARLLVDVSGEVNIIRGKITEFEAGVKPALEAVTNGGIMSMLMGRRK